MDNKEKEALKNWRRDTPGAGNCVHLNNAGAALMTQAVLDAMRDHLDLEARMGGYEAADATRPAWQSFYDSVGRLLHCPAGNIAFTDSATHSYNLALTSIAFKPGDVVLTSINDYASNQIAFIQLAHRFGVEVHHVRDLPEGGLDPGHMQELIKAFNPKLVAVTHVPTSSGLVQPVEEVGKMCSAAGCLYLVDACQSVGQLDVRVDNLKCDFLSGTFRKFLRGPRGAGFLYVSDRILADRFEPLFLDMHSATWTGPDSYDPASNATRFETWERSYALMQGARMAAEYATDIGLAKIEKRVGMLAAYLRERLGDNKNVEVLDRGEHLCGIVSFRVNGWEKPQQLHEALRRKRVNISLVPQQAALLDFANRDLEWALRASPHYYNTKDEVDNFLEVFGEILE